VGTFLKVKVFGFEQVRSVMGECWALGSGRWDLAFRYRSRLPITQTYSRLLSPHSND